MPTRILRDGILESERVDALSDGAEVFYRRLMSRVDDYGRFTANPMILRSSLYPLKVDQITVASIENWLAECSEGERPLVIVYKVGGKRYLEVQDFNQRTRTPSKYPPPSGIADSTVKQGRIYFLQGQDSKRIKIGYTEWDPANRLASFQTGSPEKLTLLGERPGTVKDERMIHRKFAGDCVGGEWFSPSADLMRFIESECSLMLANAREKPPTRAHGRSESESESESETKAAAEASADARFPLAAAAVREFFPASDAELFAQIVKRVLEIMPDITDQVFVEAIIEARKQKPNQREATLFLKTVPEIARSRLQRQRSPPPRNGAHAPVAIAEAERILADPAAAASDRKLAEEFLKGATQ